MSPDCYVGLCVHREKKPWVMELGENEKRKASGYVHDHWAAAKRVIEHPPFSKLLSALLRMNTGMSRKEKCQSRNPV